MISLAKWIDARHLSSAAVEAYAAEISSSRLGMLVLDNFLVPDKLDLLRRLVSTDGTLEQVNVAYRGRRSLERDAFDALAESQRFYSELIYRGPAPGHEMAPSVLTDLMFRRILNSRAFLDHLGAMMADISADKSMIELRAMSGSDVLNWHDDKGDHRVACLIVYLHERWRPEHGGRFLCRRKGEANLRAVEPLPNRAILFDPRADTEHAVEPLINPGDGWARINYTIWTSGSPTA